MRKINSASPDTANSKSPEYYTLVANFFCCSLIFFSSIAFGQGKVVFRPISRFPVISGIQFGYAKDDKSIFIRDKLNYYLYSFKANTWDKLNLTERLKEIPNGSIMSYVPSFDKVLTFTGKDQIEVLDAGSLQLTFLQIEGGFPKGSSRDVWQDKIYLFGGSIVFPGKAKEKAMEYSNKLLVFDPANLSFQELAPFPNQRFTDGIFVNGKLYTFGGYRDNMTFRDILRYDPEVNTWETLGLLPHGIKNYAIAAANEFIYLIGLHELSGFLGIYNTLTNQYSEYPTNLKLTKGAACVYDNKLFYFGGLDIDFPEMANNKLRVVDLSTLPK